MEIKPRSPLTELLRSEQGPVHHYHVVFWRQPIAPDGRAQETIMWAATENDVLDATDVHEVITWADDEARKRTSTYTLYAVIKTPQGEGTIWLAGVNPTAHSRPNFERQHPPDVNPVSGTPSDVYHPDLDPPATEAGG